MSLIVQEACRILAAHISTNVASLTNKVRREWADPAQDEGMPVCGLVPRRFTPEWSNEIALGGTAPTSLIQIGLVTGTIELRVAHQTAYQRADLCDQVLALFMQPGAAATATCTKGVLVLPTAAMTVGGVSTGVSTKVAFDLDTYEWEEERVFDAARFAFLDLTCEIPILVARTDAYAITDLRLGINADLDNAATEASFTDEVSVTAGSVTPYP